MVLPVSLRREGPEWAEPLYPATTTPEQASTSWRHLGRAYAFFTQPHLAQLRAILRSNDSFAPPYSHSYLVYH